MTKDGASSQDFALLLLPLEGKSLFFFVQLGGHKGLEVCHGVVFKTGRKMELEFDRFGHGTIVTEVGLGPLNGDGSAQLMG